MRVLVFVILALLGAAIAVPRRQQRIVGGIQTTIETYPYMSSMMIEWSGILWYQYCGGTLINTQSVLSNAECYLGDSPSDWRVRLGSTLSGSGGTEHAVSQLIIHPQYDSSTIENDIAIVRLATPAVFSASVAAVSLAGPNYNLADGTPVTAIGWGATAYGGSNPSTLRHVDINIINQEYCAEQYAYLKTLFGFAHWPDVTDNMLCAGIQHVGGKDACLGDTGGPLVHNSNVQVGIVSWAYRCAHADYPGVNTRVSQYTDWIVANA